MAENHRETLNFPLGSVSVTDIKTFISKNFQEVDKDLTTAKAKEKASRLINRLMKGPNFRTLQEPQGNYLSKQTADDLLALRWLSNPEYRVRLEARISDFEEQDWQSFRYISEDSSEFKSADELKLIQDAIKNARAN